MHHRLPQAALLLQLAISRSIQATDHTTSRRGRPLLLWLAPLSRCCRCCVWGPVSAAAVPPGLHRPPPPEQQPRLAHQQCLMEGPCEGAGGVEGGVGGEAC